MFREKLLTFTRPLENDRYGIYDPLGVSLLRREHKLKHNFADTLANYLNPLCPLSL